MGRGESEEAEKPVEPIKVGIARHQAEQTDETEVSEFSEPIPFHNPSTA